MVTAPLSRRPVPLHKMGNTFPHFLATNKEWLFLTCDQALFFVSLGETYRRDGRNEK